MIAHLDYETRSAADLTEVGAHRYACDKTFRILMAAVGRDDSDEILLWLPEAYRSLIPHQSEAAEKLLNEADEIYAHNAPFEQACTWGAVQQGIPCPLHKDDLSKWRCTAAMARKAGLPHSLEKMAEALNLNAKKDALGKKLIKLFSIPREDGSFALPHDHVAEFKQFADYCVQDVRVEREGHRKLKAFELKGSSLATFQFDLRMNMRGIPINLKAAQNAQKIIDEVQSSAVTEFRKLTGLNPTQREKVRQLVGLPNMQSDTVAGELGLLAVANQAAGSHTPDKARQHQRVLELYQSLSFSAVKKIQTMLDCICPDGVIRGTFRYYGAGPGRWSAQGLQPHNFRKTDPAYRAVYDEIYALIVRGTSAEVLNQLYGSPLECIANIIRAFIQHPKHTLLDGDYSAIEGRIACWDAGQKDILEDWRHDRDLYKRAAAFALKKTESELTKDERNFGKVVELACQFGLGTEGFIRTCDAWGIPCTVELAERAVHEYYRPTHRMIVQRWYAFGSWLINACEGSLDTGPLKVRTIAGIKYLLMELPSGRSIAYPHIELRRREPNAEELEKMANGYSYHPNRFKEVTYWGQLPQSQQWGRVKLHGSLVFQNRVQGIAADFMAHGAVVAESQGMSPFMLVHDQGVALNTTGAKPEQYAQALGDLPPWAKGFPMKVEVDELVFWKK